MNHVGARRIACFVVLTACGVGTVAAYVRSLERDPTSHFLTPEEGADWIRRDRPFAVRSHREGGERTEFRTRFAHPVDPANCRIVVKALGRATVDVNGSRIEPTQDSNAWRTGVTVDLGTHIWPGANELRIAVSNQNGPAMLLVVSPMGPPSSGPEWEARLPGGAWTAALPADEGMRTPRMVERYGTTPEAVRRWAPILAMLFVGAFAVSTARPLRVRAKLLGRRVLGRPMRVKDFQTLLVGLWCVFAVNSLVNVPRLGFDGDAHLDYVTHMMGNWVPPLATDGWQMFQTPLYYVVAAAWTRITMLFADVATAERLLRVIPLACGLGQLLVCGRVVAMVFPKRPDLQCLGLLLGGLMPINLYMSQHLGNEPLAGFLTALAAHAVVRSLTDAEYADEPRTPWTIGGWLSLAILTKVTAILLIPPVLGSLVYVGIRRRQGTRRILVAVGQCVLVVGLLTGWYFARNWIELGRPYIGGWDSSRGIVWWQDPGFRTRHDLLAFGGSLIQPIYAARYGFWDAIYSTLWLDGLVSGIASFDDRPPWNESLMLCAPWLALLPTTAILIGVPASWFHVNDKARPALLFGTACLAVYFAAMLALFCRLPIYGTAKATYTLGLLPCYALIGTAGFESFLRWRWLRGTIYGGMACWAVFGYLAYFAV